MQVEVGCRSCGAVAVDAGDLHVRLLPAGFGPCADFLCPVCGTRRSYGIACEDALRLVPHGALVVDCSGVVGPGRSVGLPPLGPQHAAELRDLLATEGWFDEV